VSELVDVARAGGSLSDAADARTRLLIDGFLHTVGPPPARFSWVVLGSHARRELHCASDQDSALFWDTPQAADSSYAKDLANTVIDGLEEFGMRRCDGGYMADTWSYSVEDWEGIFRERVNAPTAQAVIDAEVFLDVRPLTSAVNISSAMTELAMGSQSPRLMHGLAVAANGFPTPLGAFGRLPRGPVDLKKNGLAPIVLLARLYALKAGVPDVGTQDRLVAAAPVLGEELSARLSEGYALMSRLRLANQLRQIDDREYLTDTIDPGELTDVEHDGLRDAFRAIKSAQSVTSVKFRTDL
jgi:CBS domain-containing protein